MLDQIGNEQLERAFAGEADRIEYAYDLSGNITFLNQAGELISGYSAQEVRRMNISQLVTSESIEQMRSHFSEMVEQDLGLVFEIDIITRDGRLVALEVGMRLAREGQLVEIQGSAVPSVLRSATSQPARHGMHEHFVF